MKLNLGCGTHHIKGFINVDIRKKVSPDLVCDVRSLPFPDNSCEIVVAYDILEHLSWRETVPVLKEWLRVLSPKGFMLIRVPDFDRISLLLYFFSFERLSALVCGGQDYPENTHKAVFTEYHFLQLSKSLGFRIERVWKYPNSFNIMFKIAKVK